MFFLRTVHAPPVAVNPVDDRERLRREEIKELDLFDLRRLHEQNGNGIHATPAEPAERTGLMELHDDPAYLAAVNNLAALEKRAKELREKISTALPLAAKSDAGPLELVVGADALRSGVDFSAIDGSDGKSEAARDAAELAKLQRAVDLQRTALNRLRMLISERIIGDVTPKYRAIVRELAVAVQNLLTASAKEADFRYPLLIGDISFGDLRPMPIPDATVHALKAFLIECQEYGFTK